MLPNILVIICDDLGYGDIGCYGYTILHTPQLDRLASEGIRLTHYRSGPVCTPARASLMTGRHPYRTRAFDTYLGRSMLDPEECTLAQVLRMNGHATGLFGKWHLGDRHPMRPNDLGFDEALYHTGGGLEQPANIGACSYFSPDLMHNGRREPSSGYCTDIFTDATIDFMAAQGERPFFAYLAYNAPHVPLQVAESWVAPYRDVVPEMTARLYGMVANIDWNVGRLLAALDRLGITDNTIVVFTSDHGPAGSPRFNGGLRGQKGSVFDGGLRVPALVRWPASLPAGQILPVPCGPIDWLPTLAAASGAAIPQDRRIDGVNLLPHLSGSHGALDEREIIFQWHRGDTPEPRRNATVISGRYKLVWAQREPPQLFDLSEDPAESSDLSDTLTDEVVRLDALYQAWWDDVSTERGDDTFAPPRIILGSPHEPQSVLTWQDWRLYTPREDEWWSADMPGFWEVHVARRGSYRITIDFAVPPACPHVHFRCGSTHLQATVQEKDCSIAFSEVHLEAGASTLEAFLGSNLPIQGPARVWIEGPIDHVPQEIPLC